MPAARQPKPGRPAGSRSFDPRSAAAFGDVVRTVRAEAGLSQEALASASEIERSHFSRIERGLSQPTLFAVLKIAAAVGLSASQLVEQTEQLLARPRRK